MKPVQLDSHWRHIIQQEAYKGCEHRRESLPCYSGRQSEKALKCKKDRFIIGLELLKTNCKIDSRESIEIFCYITLGTK